MKILFLDFDGVLVIDPPYRVANEACVRRLNRITSQTGARIVVSSSWRHEKDPGHVIRVLNTWGVTAPCVGQTPRMDNLLKSGLWVGVDRGDEIREWLYRNPNVKSVVILDDERIGESMAHFHVKSEFKTGLTDEIADKAIAILQYEGMKTVSLATAMHKPVLFPQEEKP